MEEQLMNWIQHFQHTGDHEALLNLREACWPVVETLIGELVKENEPEKADELRQKGMERFPFIVGKYRQEVQLPIETFLRNTYRFYFQQVMREK
ncbi:hypothetical protein [Bacillus atrophaeus]|uniref:hypothetical protein n=1 Tax=Bacillus atrophaeus TaxID=1452 RepID=UPI000C059F4A|nr:hypothetical protein [Bacillus atrophaeus]ATO26689.1 hypothetical protein RA13_00365 [Bacillus atrophaeus]PSA89727.1 hypothetical protein C6371_17910 [Bacillus atrophaeus]WNV80036.1 hypothetical protein RUL31_01360 [Bacillus atrophaeus]